MKEEEYQLTGHELQTELLKRMGYTEASKKCSNCNHYCGSFSLTDLPRCKLIPLIDLNVSDDAWCKYYEKMD